MSVEDAPWQANTFTDYVIFLKPNIKDKTQAYSNVILCFHFL